MGEFITNNFWIVAIIGLWSLYWKGRSLWRSARRDEGVWFVVLLVMNTAGILDVLYIFIFSRKKEEKVKRRNHVQDK